jgi:membrane fusion protein (multidrug efflux system)
MKIYSNPGHFTILLTITLLLSACGEKKQTASGPAAQRPVMVSGVAIIPREIREEIQSTGTILANEEVEIRSEVAGRIISINFTEGTRVNKGNLLVKINDDELQAQLKKLILEEGLAKDDVYRKSRLLEINAVSQEEYDISQNQLAVIQAQIDLVKSQISKTTIVAPFSGQIGLRYVSPGGYISSSMLIARMQDTDPVKIEFSVPEKYLGRVAPGTELFFSIEGSDSLFSGTVYAIDPKIDPSTRSLTARAKSPNPGRLLYPGAFAKVRLMLQTVPDALVVPSETLIPDIRGEKVYVCKDGKVKVVYVETGIRTERDVQITAGLNPGDTVITTGLLQIRENMSVTIRP